MDKQELKRQVKLNSKLHNTQKWLPAFIDVPVMCDLIDQLDEPEKVVVPAFVGEWIEENKERRSLLWIAQEIEVGLDNLDVDRWIECNFDLFARAWVYGFAVEDKKYEVILPAVTGAKDVYMVIDEDSSVYFESMDYIVRNACLKSEFTEQEIKAIDPRYMAFAIPVEEEEE